MYLIWPSSLGALNAPRPMSNGSSIHLGVAYMMTLSSPRALSTHQSTSISGVRSPPPLSSPWRLPLLFMSRGVQHFLATSMTPSILECHTWWDPKPGALNGHLPMSITFISGWHIWLSWTWKGSYPLYLQDTNKNQSHWVLPGRPGPVLVQTRYW